MLQEMNERRDQEERMKEEGRLPPGQSLTKSIKGRGGRCQFGNCELADLDEQTGPGKPLQVLSKAGERLLHYCVLDDYFPASGSGHQPDLEKLGGIKQAYEPVAGAHGSFGHRDQAPPFGGQHLHS